MKFDAGPRAALMVLSSIIEPGEAELDDFLGEVGPVAAVEAIWERDLPERLHHLTSAVVERIRDPVAHADELRSAGDSCGATVLIPTDPQWPQRLHELQLLATEDQPHLRPPRCLWVRGATNLSAICERSISIVGARAASDYGRFVSDQLAGDLGEAGWTIVSGGAYGIDRAAHLGAVSREATTVAVLAGGVDRPYPSGNARLFELIEQRGSLVSEWPPGCEPRRYRFLIRNRAIAALSVGTVVVEAAPRSGAKHTARLAAELDRTLMYTPGPITSITSAGVHQLARECWEPRLVTSAAEVIADVSGFIPEPVFPGAADNRPLDGWDHDCVRIYEALCPGWVREETELAAEVGLPVTHARECLMNLAAAGWVAEVNGRWKPLRAGIPPQ
ncbi:DNA-processing protein DprA [Haloglycomyces albus]|uniref:DNA-processing protein DprA n=1 Tax=Haloglycomyces albus TaxID=526067 RepID=UPI00046D5C70|nr:DNA-processing protein DprA [Haloglycomyces albus]